MGVAACYVQYCVYVRVSDFGFHLRRSNNDPSSLVISSKISRLEYLRGAKVFDLQPGASSTFITLSGEGWFVTLAGSSVRWGFRMLLLLRWRDRVVVVTSSVCSSTFFDLRLRYAFRQDILEFGCIEKSLYIYSQLYIIDL